MRVGAPIDASLRRATLIAEAKGHLVPDSVTKLAVTPQLIMEPGVERLALKFADGLGLTDAYGNVYEGYQRSSSSFTWVHEGSSSIGTTLDAGLDGQVPVYDPGTDEYTPQYLYEEDWVMFIIEKPTNRTYPLAIATQTPIEILGGVFQIEAGTASVSTPTGPVTVGQPYNITVSGTNAASAFLKVQVNYRKQLINA